MLRVSIESSFELRPDGPKRRDEKCEGEGEGKFGARRCVGDTGERDRR
jgi:hypothetical protein